MQTLTNLKEIGPYIEKVKIHDDITELCKQWLESKKVSHGTSIMPHIATIEETMEILNQVSDWLLKKGVRINDRDMNLSGRLLQRLQDKTFIIHFKEEKYYLHVVFKEIKVKKTRMMKFIKNFIDSVWAIRMYYFSTQKGMIFSLQRQSEATGNVVLIFFTAHSFDRWAEREDRKFDRSLMLNDMADCHLIMLRSKKNASSILFIMEGTTCTGVMVGHWEYMADLKQDIFFSKTFISFKMFWEEKDVNLRKFNLNDDWVEYK